MASVDEKDVESPVILWLDVFVVNLLSPIKLLLNTNPHLRELHEKIASSMFFVTADGCMFSSKTSL